MPTVERPDTGEVVSLADLATDELLELDAALVAEVERRREARRHVALEAVGRCPLTSTVVAGERLQARVLRERGRVRLGPVEPRQTVDQAAVDAAWEALGWGREDET